MKLWWYQIQQQQSLNNLKINRLAEKNSVIKHNYSLTIAKIKHKYEADLNGKFSFIYIFCLLKLHFI